MQAAFDYAVEYIHNRKQFGQPVGTFQLMQGKSACSWIMCFFLLILSPLQPKLQICIQNSMPVDHTCIL